MEHRRRVTVDLAALAEPAARAAIAVLAALAALVVPGLASVVVWASRAWAALVAVAALAAPAGMRAFSATAQQVVTPALVALVERVVQRARLAQTLRRCSAGLAGLAVMPALLVVARRARAAWMEHRRRVTVDQAAWAELAVRAAMLVLAALEAAVVPGRAATVVWVRQASAAMVAMAVLAAPVSMRAA